MSLNPKELAIKARLDYATPGPWEIDYQTPFGVGGAVCSARNIHTSSWHPIKPDVEICKQPHMDKNNHINAWANGRFIANAPTDIEHLLATVSRLREALYKIANETDENSNFSRSEQECEYYINIAKHALEEQT